MGIGLGYPSSKISLGRVIPWGFPPGLPSRFGNGSLSQVGPKTLSKVCSGDPRGYNIPGIVYTFTGDFVIPEAGNGVCEAFAGMKIPPGVVQEPMGSLFSGVFSLFVGNP